jgi:hypothetical protein
MGMAIFGPARPAGGVCAGVVAADQPAVVGQGRDGACGGRAGGGADGRGSGECGDAADATSDEGPCRILRVVDGDTVTLMCPEERDRAGADCRL